MALISLSGFEPVLGKVIEAVSLMKEAQEIINAQGGKAQVLSLARGGKQGSLSVVVENDDAAAYGAALDALNADTGWQSFMARAQAAQAAIPVRSVDYAEIPGFERDFEDVASSRVIMATLGQIREGRGPDALEAIQGWKTLTEKHGGKCRALQSIASDPAFVTASISYYDSFTEWGKTIQALGADPEWQAFIAEARGANGSVDIMRISVFQVI